MCGVKNVSLPIFAVIRMTKLGNQKEAPMWERLRSVWTVPDLRNKILFTLGILLITRILANIPVPLTSAEQSALRGLFSNPNSNGNLGQIFGLLDVFSGGNLRHFSIIAMGVYPY